MNSKSSGFWLIRLKDETSQSELAQRLNMDKRFVWDAVSPYLNDACRLAVDREKPQLKKNLRRCSFIGSLVGLSIACLWIYLTQWDQYPRWEVQGRIPGLAQWAAYIPVLFELLILGAGVGCLYGFLRTSRLPQWHQDYFNTHSCHGGPDSYIILIQNAQWEEFQPLLDHLDIDESEYVEGVVLCGK